MLGKRLIIYGFGVTNASLARALDYKDVMDRYAQVQNLEVLTDFEWLAISAVTKWLALFATATTAMSSTEKTTLSAVYGVFTGLQDDVRTHLRDNTNGIPPALKNGLVQAHEKLSEYFRKTDASPYYLWSSCAWPWRVQSQHSMFYSS
jgi:hypothetical protein